MSSKKKQIISRLWKNIYQTYDVGQSNLIINDERVERLPTGPEKLYYSSIIKYISNFSNFPITFYFFKSILQA